MEHVGNTPESPIDVSNVPDFDAETAANIIKNEAQINELGKSAVRAAFEQTELAPQEAAIWDAYDKMPKGKSIFYRSAEIGPEAEVDFSAEKEFLFRHFEPVRVPNYLSDSTRQTENTIGIQGISLCHEGGKPGEHYPLNPETRKLALLSHVEYIQNESVDQDGFFARLAEENSKWSGPITEAFIRAEASILRSEYRRMKDEAIQEERDNYEASIPEDYNPSRYVREFAIEKGIMTPEEIEAYDSFASYHEETVEKIISMIPEKYEEMKKHIPADNHDKEAERWEHGDLTEHDYEQGLAMAAYVFGETKAEAKKHMQDYPNEVIRENVITRLKELSIKGRAKAEKGAHNKIDFGLAHLSGAIALEEADRIEHGNSEYEDLDFRKDLCKKMRLKSHLGHTAKRTKDRMIARGTFFYPEGDSEVTKAYEELGNLLDLRNNNELMKVVSEYEDRSREYYGKLFPKMQEAEERSSLRNTYIESVMSRLSEINAERDANIDKLAEESAGFDLFSMKCDIAEALVGRPITIRDVYILPSGVIIRDASDNCRAFAIEPMDERITSYLDESQSFIWQKAWSSYNVKNLDGPNKVFRERLSHQVAVELEDELENPTGIISEDERKLYEALKENNIIISSTLNQDKGTLNKSPLEYEEVIKPLVKTFGAFISKLRSDFNTNTFRSNSDTLTSQLFSYFSGETSSPPDTFVNENCEVKVNNIAYALEQEPEKTNEIINDVALSLASNLYTSLPRDDARDFIKLVRSRLDISETAFYARYRRRVSDPKTRRVLVCRSLFANSFCEYITGKATPEISAYFDELKDKIN
ncbi:MAG: hypothetical protein Q4E47_00050 [Candidatus Saccharibacteria bacterium]|nr:hypothetical protein [Candidatus Saccharibacteria bacterium]